MPRIKSFFLFAMMIGLCLGAAAAQTPQRIDIPIRDVPLGNGLHLYSIAIKVGTTEIETGLDTGSTGLRVFPGTLAAGDAQQGSSARDANFTSGVRYEGNNATGMLTLGGLAASVTFEAINTIECQPDRSNCPATQIPASDYGVRGNSLTGGRFRAIIGINTGQNDIQNPLLQMGVKRWIVTLPRAGETGHLILNPADQEINDFLRLPRLAALRERGSLRDAVQGCILDSQKNSNCGPLLMDSGAPNLHLVNGTMMPDVLAKGSAAALVFYSSQRPIAVEQLVIGQPENGTVFRADANRNMKFTTILAGSAPFFGFDVLYDQAADDIGLRPRLPISGSPVGQAIAQ
jgi:hypothetical protein